MEKSPTYSPTYSLTYPFRYSSATTSRVPTSTTLSLSLSLEISPWRLRAHLWIKGCRGGSLPGGRIPITSIVRPTSAYFDKSSRSTGFCLSVARFSHLNSRLNRVANTYLLTYLLTRPQSFAEFHSTWVRTRNVFIVLNYVLKIRIYIMLIAPIKIITTLNDVISPVHLRS